MELKNVPKVCKAVARLCRLVRFSISSWWWRWSCLLDTRYKDYLGCKIFALWMIKYQRDMKDSFVQRRLLTARMRTWEALLVESRPSVRGLAFNLCESCLKTIPKWSQSWHPGLLLVDFLCLIIWSIFEVLSFRGLVLNFSIPRGATIDSKLSWIFLYNPLHYIIICFFAWYDQVMFKYLNHIIKNAQ